jgi:hypothetical protein
MVASFQSTVNVQNAFGVAGALYDDGPVRSAQYELNSASASYNVIGATAYTLTTADPGNAQASGVATAGGSGAFVGILMNSKVYATSGPTTGAIDPTMSLPNFILAELLTMGDIIVQLPGPANVGDKVCYDNTTGKLSTYPALTSFTASLLSTGVLSVSAVNAGLIQVGMKLAGPLAIANVYITAVGTGTGFTGTYTTNYVGATVSAEAMTATSLPPPAASVTAAIFTPGILSVSAVASGELGVGSVLSGTGVPSNTVITALGTGLGSTGTYTINTASSFTLGSATITADAQTQVPDAEVYRYNPAGGAGLGVIKITN